MSRPKSACGAALWVSLSFLPAAHASVETDSQYTKSQAYNAALRYLRVDLSYEVVERDAEAAYLLFKYVPQGRKVPANGSIEIVERRDGIRLMVRLPEMPRYQEAVLSEGLIRKLTTEYGEPPRREEPPKKAPKAGERDPKKDETERKDEKKGSSEDPPEDR